MWMADSGGGTNVDEFPQAGVQGKAVDTLHGHSQRNCKGPRCFKCPRPPHMQINERGASP